MTVMRARRDRWRHHPPLPNHLAPSGTVPYGPYGSIKHDFDCYEDMWGDGGGEGEGRVGIGLVPDLVPLTYHVVTGEALYRDSACPILGVNDRITVVRIHQPSS